MPVTCFNPGLNMSQTQYSEPVLVLFLGYSTHEVPLLRFYSRILKVFYSLKENFKQSFQLLYAISSFRLFINQSSCSTNANAVYGVFVITVITAFKPAPIMRPSCYNTANFFWPIGDRINGVPCSVIESNGNLSQILHITDVNARKYTTVTKQPDLESKQNLPLLTLIIHRGKISETLIMRSQTWVKKRKEIRHRKRKGNKEERKYDNRNAGRKRDRSFQTQKRVASMENYVSARWKRDGYKQLCVSVEFTKYGDTLFRPLLRFQFSHGFQKFQRNLCAREVLSFQICITL